jgi:hypothetical protein
MCSHFRICTVSHRFVASPNSALNEVSQLLSSRQNLTSVRGVAVNSRIQARGQMRCAVPDSGDDFSDPAANAARAVPFPLRVS